MQKTLTLYPRYITDGSNFGGILSANGTGQDYRTLYKDKGHDQPDSCVVGTIGFDTSPLWNKSAACILNDFSVSADVWVNEKRDGSSITSTFRPRLLSSFDTNGTQLSVNGYSDFGSIGWMTTGYINANHQSISLFSGESSDVIGYRKMLSF